MRVEQTKWGVSLSLSPVLTLDDAEHTHADISKATELIGYEPSRDIREGVGEFIEWYERNREWYEPLVVSS